MGLPVLLMKSGMGGAGEDRRVAGAVVGPKNSMSGSCTELAGDGPTVAAATAAAAVAVVTLAGAVGVAGSAAAVEANEEVSAGVGGGAWGVGGRG